MCAVAALHTRYRFGESIGALAEAIRIGDAEGAVKVLRAGGEHVEWIDTDRPAEPLHEVLVPHALRVREAAVLGDAERALATLDEHRLCARTVRDRTARRALEPAGAALAIGRDEPAAVGWSGTPADRCW